MLMHKPKNGKSLRRYWPNNRTYKHHQMIRIMKKVWILSLSLIVALGAQALTFTAGNLRYDTKGDSVTVSLVRQSYTLTGSQVIPASVVYEGKSYRVFSIDATAFKSCRNLTSVSLPEGLISIGDEAFESSGLTSVTIPASVTTIGKKSFANCGALKLFAVAADNPVFSVEDGVLFTKDKSKLIAYPISKGLTNYSIPSGVTEIDSYAFSNGSALTSILIPSSVTSIGEGAFFSCIRLTSLVIPKNVIFIGASAFYSCSAITSITIPEGINTIEKYTFFNCRSLVSVSIPNGVTKICWHAFADNKALKEIRIMSELPPLMETNVFNNTNMDQSTLYVPNGKKERYSESIIWEDFKRIVEVGRDTSSFTN